MEFTSTPFDGLWVIQPNVLQDQRGYFFESYNRVQFDRQLPPVNFLQDNQSLSGKNILRGLHFQDPPHAQVKLVRVIKGSVMDVVVDIRKKSSTYGGHFKIELSEKNKTMLWIPEGFAHGFISKEEDTVLLYKCSNTFNKASERCLIWNDQDLKIDWGNGHPIISEKDNQGAHFKTFTSLF